MNLLILTLSLLLHPPLLVQDTTIAPLKENVYTINIKGNPSSTSGYLGAIGDSAISVSSRPVHYGDNTSSKLVPYNIIDRVSMHRKGSAGKGVLFGALGGIILGGIVGALTYTKPTPTSRPDWFKPKDISTSTVVGCAVGFLLGTPIGTLIGSEVHHYDINRNKGNYDYMRSQLINVYGKDKVYTRSPDLN